MDSFLGVPIRIGQQLYGMLYLTDKEDGSPFNDEDQLLIETLAGYAGLAIASAEVNQQHNRLHLLEERERIGMELHDGIIQSLYGIGMQVELLRLEDEITGNRLVPVIQSLNDVIEDIRRYILDLRYGNAKQLSVQEFMREIPKRLHAPEHINFNVEAPDVKPPFAPSVFESICLIASEAVSNAIRHAQANTITLRVDQYDDEGYFVIEVEDDGKGFIMADAEQQSGLGLRNMQRRARLYGGEVLINSQIQRGTQLSIRIPLRAY
jgi:two-component system sensor histidine kinase DevS